MSITTPVYTNNKLPTIAVVPLQMSVVGRLVSCCLSLICVSLFAATPTTQREAPVARDKFQQVKELVETEFLKDGRGGLTIGIVEAGSLVWEHHFGFAEEAHKVRVTGETIYPIGSLTKMVTGIMLLQLVERGRVHLTDTVETYVPEIQDISNPYSWAPPVTLLQLATMTGGLGSDCCSAEWKDTFEATDTWDKRLLSGLHYLKYDYEPGTRRKYSNWSYCILGLALSRAAGRPFTEYVQSEILQPLGMSNTSFSIQPTLETRVVRGYVPGTTDAYGIRAENSDQDFSLPAGGLVSTLGDLVKFMRFQLGGAMDSVVTNKTLQASYQLIVPSDGNLQYGDSVGFSAVRNPDSQLTVLGHGGLLRGFVASYAFDLSAQSGVILLTNTSYGHADYKPLVRKILGLLNPSSIGGTGLPPTETH